MATATHLQNPFLHINSNQPFIRAGRCEGATFLWVVAVFTILASISGRKHIVAGSVENKVALMAAEQDLDTNSSGADRGELRGRKTHV
jgi:hypothetical protein